MATKYRVNIDIEVKDVDGKLFRQPHHVGFWETFPQARTVSKGLDVRGLAFHYNHTSGYTPTGKAFLVVTECKFAKGALVSQNVMGTTEYEYGVSDRYRVEENA